MVGFIATPEANGPTFAEVRGCDWTPAAAANQSLRPDIFARKVKARRIPRSRSIATTGTGRLASAAILRLPEHQDKQT